MAKAAANLLCILRSEPSLNCHVAATCCWSIRKPHSTRLDSGTDDNGYAAVATAAWSKLSMSTSASKFKSKSETEVKVKAENPMRRVVPMINDNKFESFKGRDLRAFGGSSEAQWKAWLERPRAKSEAGPRKFWKYCKAAVIKMQCNVAICYSFLQRCIKLSVTIAQQKNVI